mmetsp:Transcript_8320/g.51852  ORF Transcript_8320/g.51852 Transcript_8320/m.51852 type:complete len:242 (+) Transcript_8320:3174-3899(+)
MQGVEASARLRIPHLEAGICRCGDHVRAVGCEPAAGDGSSVAMEAVHESSFGGIPHPRGTVFCTCQHHVSTWMPVHPFHAIAGSVPLPLLLCCGHVPHTNVSVQTTRGQGSTVHGERQSRHAVAMCVQGRHLHGRRRTSHVRRVVSSSARHATAARAPRHGVHRASVHLQHRGGVVRRFRAFVCFVIRYVVAQVGHHHAFTFGHKRRSLAFLHHVVRHRLDARTTCARFPTCGCATVVDVS